MTSDYTPGDANIVFCFVHQSTCNPSAKKAFAEPAHNAAPRRLLLRLRRKRIVRFRRTRRARNEQPASRGVGRPSGGSSESRKGLRPPDTNLLVEHLPRQIARARELRAAAGQNGASSRRNIETGLPQPRLDLGEGLIETGLNDARQHRASDAVAAALALL